MPAVLPLEGTGAPQSEGLQLPPFGTGSKQFEDAQVVAATYLIQGKGSYSDERFWTIKIPDVDTKGQLLSAVRRAPCSVPRVVPNMLQAPAPRESPPVRKRGHAGQNTH